MSDGAGADAEGDGLDITGRDGLGVAERDEATVTDADGEYDTTAMVTECTTLRTSGPIAFPKAASLTVMKLSRSRD